MPYLQVGELWAIVVLYVLLVVLWWWMHNAGDFR